MYLDVIRKIKPVIMTVYTPVYTMNTLRDKLQNETSWVRRNFTSSVFFIINLTPINSNQTFCIYCIPQG